MLKVLACLLLALGAQPAWAQTAQSLGQVPGLLKTPESRQVFAQQMEGKPAHDPLGTRLPAGLSAKRIAALLLPAGGTEPLNAVGAKPLPGAAGTYVAIVCTGGNIPKAPDDPPCIHYEYGGPPVPPLHAYLGLIAARPGGVPRLLAKPVRTDGLVNWRTTNLPTVPQALDQASGDSIRPDSYDRWDLAPYIIAPHQRAFGVRGGWSEGYSGGMADYGALYLFAVVHGALRQVFAAPMSSYRDTAGSWHKNGTRTHHIKTGANILIVSTRSTNGHFDLLLKSRLGHWQRLYRWSAKDGRYRPVR